jgi:hypothetical protein
MNKNDNPPSYEEASNNLKLTEKTKTIENLIKEYEINIEYAEKLKVLNNFKIVFILDDSGSMNSKLADSPLINKNKSTSQQEVTRWDELKYFTNIIIEIANLFNTNGSDVYFLNRKSNKNITDKQQLSYSFEDKPQGYTPLELRLQEVLNDNPNLNKKLLIIIVTDGEPTDTNGKVNIKQFKDCLLKRPANVYTTIAACTDDDESIEYLNNWDKQIPRLDISDDFRSERAQIKKLKGQDYSFTFGDYIVKSLIGSIDPDLDVLDG